MKSTTLPWLIAPPTEFRAAVRALREDPVDDLKRLRALATTSLSMNQLHTLAKAANDVMTRNEVAAVRMSVISNATTDLLVPAIVATAPRHGIWVDAEGGPFGTFVSEALNPDSMTHQRQNHVVLLALDYRAFDFVCCEGEPTQAADTVANALKTLGNLAQALQAQRPTMVIVQTLPPPPSSVFGSFDAQLPGSLRWMIERFNTLLRATYIPSVTLLDVANMASAMGLEQWHDPVQWNMGKFACSHDAIPLYADTICRLMMAVKGKAKKCLVLDLDNTLWGGVIGDDGMAGIVLGQGNPVGEAFLAIQQTALDLRRRGIILAVSSKNDEVNARQVFREHPDMLLREEHIAVFQANWKDKASNLVAIAQTLQIGVDALVFLDDNPAERQQVRLALPEVGVPELPDSPEFFPAMLLSAGYFETVQYTAEDADRAQQYQQNSARTAALSSTSDMAEYLESLAMRASVRRFDSVGRARIAQLVNKTNQFNLTTRRYTEAEVALMETDPRVFGIQIRLQDRFGDNGMIGVVICREQGTEWVIDTWLMSCRVLSRRVEEVTLNVLHAAAKARGISRLIGLYRPTAKNAMVREHYLRLGFAMVEQRSDTDQWMLEVDRYQPVPVPIAVDFDAEGAEFAESDRSDDSRHIAAHDLQMFS
jgi:FkbH-like protein